MAQCSVCVREAGEELSVCIWEGKAAVTCTEVPVWMG